jgi:hypothetical protein
VGDASEVERLRAERDEARRLAEHWRAECAEQFACPEDWPTTHPLPWEGEAAPAPSEPPTLALEAAALMAAQRRSEARASEPAAPVESVETSEAGGPSPSDTGGER